MSCLVLQQPGGWVRHLPVICRLHNTVRGLMKNFGWRLVDPLHKQPNLGPRQHRTAAAPPGDRQRFFYDRL